MRALVGWSHGYLWIPIIRGARVTTSIQANEATSAAPGTRTLRRS